MKTEFKLNRIDIERCIKLNAKKGWVLSTVHELDNTKTCLVGHGYLYFVSK